MSLDARFKQLLDDGDALFSKRQTLDLLWQELAENFYPERADFTVTRSLGDDFAGNLDTSSPIVARRDLGNALGAMLRPSSKQWFHNRLKHDDREDEAARAWLQMADRVQRRAIYDRESGFERATKEADHDWATFGQTVLSSEMAVSPISGAILLHRTWHLRDVVWAENSFGQIDFVTRRWKPGARELKSKFPKAVSREVLKAAEKEPYKTFEVRHCIVESANYEKKFNQPYVSIFIDKDNETVLEEVGIWNRYYVIPRWETVSGSQYAYSPATIAALPDARTLQAMTYTLLTAGEYAVEPPLIGVSEALKNGIEMFPGGFTAIDASYDERLGEVLRPLDTGKDRNMPIGLAMQQDIRVQINDSMYLTKLALPQAGMGGMSPFEVAQRIDEFVRQNLPLFEPMEQDYNGALMDQDFDILLRNGAFGPLSDMPESIQGQDNEFRFESPLRDSIDKVKGQQFMEAKGLAVEASAMDPLAIQMVDWRKAQRDAQHGVGTPAEWMRGEAEMDDLEAIQQAAEKAKALMQTVGAGAQIAEQVGNAGQALQGATQEAPQGAPV